jgi:hypothetical protein
VSDVLSPADAVSFHHAGSAGWTLRTGSGRLRYFVEQRGAFDPPPPWFGLPGTAYHEIDRYSFYSFYFSGTK